MVLVTIVGATGYYDIVGIVGLLWYNRYNMLYSELGTRYLKLLKKGTRYLKLPLFGKSSGAAAYRY